MTEVIALTHTVTQAMQASGLSRTTLYNLMASGKLDARKVGGRTLIMADSLRRFLEATPKAVIRSSASAN